MSILSHIIDIALKKQNDSPVSYTLTDKNKSNRKNKIFGVFVTVERHHTINSFPYDVHGCIGYWDKGYQPLTNHEIISHLEHVSFSATWEDERRLSFPSLYSDLLSTFTISYMKLPIYPVNPVNGMLPNQTIFDNNKYGLIFQSKGATSTYLPEVFENATWNSIKKSLIHKAGNINRTNRGASFFAYQTISETSTIFHHLVTPFYHFILSSYGQFIPYSVAANKIVVDKTEEVRNIATIYDILQLRRYGFDLASILPTIRKNIEYYNKKKISRQASIFLILCNNEFNFPIDHYVQIILSSLDHMEPKFELGEALYTLSILSVKNPAYLPYITSMMDRISHHQREKNIKLVQKDDIFRLNWLSKTCYYHKNHPLFLSCKKQLTSWFTNHYSNELETNYLAVFYEAISSVYDHSFAEALEKVFIDLHKRRTKDGLFSFKNGDCRLDITGHILNGYYHFA